MDLYKILKLAFTVEGIKYFFTVYDKDGQLDINQILGTVIFAGVIISILWAVGTFIL